MAWVPPRTAMDKRREAAMSFNVFLSLPDSIKESLAWGVERIRNGETAEERELATYVINHYDRNNTYAIGELMDILNRFLERSINIRMAYCFVDHRCNEVLAKLAWHKDY